MGWDTVDQYFSGQGVVLVGTRDATGKPVRLKPIGNVSSLKLSVTTTTIEHKESQTGARGIDKRLTTEIKAALAMTLENYTAQNLADALRGDAVNIAAGTAAAEAITFWSGSVVPLSNINVTAITSVKRGATSLTEYVDDLTAYDYKKNLLGGSIQFNDGSRIATDKLTTGGTVPTAITAASPCVITVANSAAVGDYVIVTGLSGGTKKDSLNGYPMKITAATSSAVTIDFDNSGGTAATIGTPLSIFDGQALVVAYSYSAQKQVDSLTQGAPELYMRFEGLNTAEDNSPVVIDVFKFATDPLKELDMIGDNIQQFVLDGSVLADSLQATGSKYFRVRSLA